MFQIKKLESFFNLKTAAAVFVLAFCLGLISNSIFGRHIFRYSIIENFTRAEAGALLNKRVANVCFKNLEQGTINFYRREMNGEIFVEIKWDNPAMSKYDRLGFGKQVYRQCVIELAAE